MPDDDRPILDGMGGPLATDSNDGAWWWAVLLGALVVLSVPFFLCDLPPVLDYPNHLARLVALAFPTDPDLSAMVEPHWTILPNLALDLIGPPLVAVLPVHVAGRILLALAVFLPVLGVVAYHRAVFGVRSWWPIASAVVAFNGIFFLGFLNFLFGIGLALLAAALWIVLIDRRPVAALAVSIAAGAVLFFCHPFAVLFFLLLIGCNALVGWWRSPSLGRGLARGAIVAAAGVPSAILLPLSPTSVSVGAAWVFAFARKPVDLLTPFMTYDQPVMGVTAAAVLAAFVLLARRSKVDAGSVLALAGLAAAFVVAPSAIAGGAEAFIDARLPLMMVLMAFACLSPAIPRGAERLLGAAAAVLLLVRTADVGLAWAGHQADVTELRAAIAPVEPKARVLVVSAWAAASDAYLASEPAARRVPGLYRMELNMGALVMIERHAFWPLLFASPRQQPVRVRPPYDAIALSLGDPPDYRRLAGAGEAAADATYLSDWAGKFDYVLLLHAGAVADLAAVEPGRLDLLTRSDFAALYKVRRAL